MNFGAVLDSVYVLGSLWGTLTGPRVCLAIPYTEPAAAGAFIPQAPPRVTAFVDVNVVPMDRERVLAHQTVVVEGGRISMLGPSSQVEVPANAVRIDGKGKYLIPGLGNMHVHRLGIPSTDAQIPAFADLLASKYLAWGVTTIRTLEDPHLEEMQQLRRILGKGGFPSPRMYLAREIPRSMLTKPESIAAYVAESKAAGYDHIGTSYGLHARSPEQRAVFDSLVAAARRVGLPISAHSHPISFDATLALGTTGGATDHLFAFWDSLLGKPGPTTTMFLAMVSKPVDWPMAKVPALVAAVKRSGVWIVPTLACMERVHAYIQTGMPQLVKALHDAGVGLLLGEDGADVHNELAALVRAGLTPHEALLTGTRNVAQYFGKLDDVGTVAVGKHADLVLLRGNPLADIQYTRKPAGVMAAGQWLDLD